MPQFEVFKKRNSRPSQQPRVALQKGGGFSLNGAAHEALGSPKAIELLFDPNERIIGLRGVDIDAAHAYPLRTTAAKLNPSYLASGAAFVKYYGIDASTSQRWDAYMVDDVLCVNIAEQGDDAEDEVSEDSASINASLSRDEDGTLRVVSDSS